MSRFSSFRESIARLSDPQSFRRMEAITQTAEAATHELQESLADLQQLTREGRGWYLMSMEYDQLFDRNFLNELIKVSRVYFLKNPIIQRGVVLQSYYVFGRGVEIRCDDEPTNKILQDFLHVNRKQLGVTGLTDAEQAVQNDGNLFYAAFRDQNLGAVKIRTIDAIEITEVATNPEDAEEVWYYKRVWTQKSYAEDRSVSTKPLTKWYPAMSYRPAAGYPPKFGGFEVETRAVIHHRKVGAPTKSAFGYPLTYASQDWADAYRRFLNAWLTKEEALARVAMKINTPGGQKAIDKIGNKLQTSIGPGQARETNPAPQTGSTWIGGPNQDIQTIKTQGSNTSPDEARRAFLMAVMAFGPETFFGDASVGSLATAQSLDRPTELKFLHAQNRWREDLEDLCGYAIEQAQKAPAGGLRQVDAKPVQVLVSFPDILEHDIVETINAIVAAATLNGDAPAGTIDQRTLCAMLLQALGMKDVSNLVDDMYPKDGYNPQDWAAANPEERAQMAADMASKATIAAANANKPVESAGAAVLAASLGKLLEAMKTLPARSA